MCQLGRESKPTPCIVVGIPHLQAILTLSRAPLSTLTHDSGNRNLAPHAHNQYIPSDKIHDVPAGSWLILFLRPSFSFSRPSIRIWRPSIWSSAPELNSSMILNTRHSRPMTTSEPASSIVPCRRTSTMKPATMTVASKIWNFELKYLPGLRQCFFLQKCIEHPVKLHPAGVRRIWWEDLREAKRPNRRQQFDHEQARKHQAHNIQCLVCPLPLLLMEALLTGMLAYVQ